MSPYRLQGADVEEEETPRVVRRCKCYGFIKCKWHGLWSDVRGFFVGVTAILAFVLVLLSFVGTVTSLATKDFNPMWVVCAMYVITGLAISGGLVATVICLKRKYDSSFEVVIE